MLVKHQADDSNEHKWPLDGGWIVEWDTGDRARIRVQRHEFQYDTIRYVLDVSDPCIPQFEWPFSEPRVVQTALEGVDLEAHPEGPPVGSRIVWTTSPQVNERIVWVSLRIL